MKDKDKSQKKLKSRPVRSPVLLRTSTGGSHTITSNGLNSFDKTAFIDEVRSSKNKFSPEQMDGDEGVVDAHISMRTFSSSVI
jgi:hypothetical protein